MRLVGLLDGIEPLVAWFLYRKVFGGSLRLYHLRDALAFLVSGPLVACMTSAVVGTLVLSSLGRIAIDNIRPAIGNWWLGNAIGTLAIAPSLLLLLTPTLQRWGWVQASSYELEQARNRFSLTQKQWLEVLLILLTACVTAEFTVHATQQTNFAFQQLSLLSFIPILWAATRFSVTGAMLTASFCVLVTLLHYLILYPSALYLPQFPVSPEILHLHKLSLAVQCAVGLLVGTAVSERSASLVELAVERVRSAENEARARLTEQLLKLNSELSEVNQQLADREGLLQASNKRYRDLAEAMPQMVWTANAAGMVDYFNQQWFAYTHLSESESLRHTGVNVVHPEDRDRTLELWRQSVTTGTPFQIEYRIRRYDDTYRWFISRGLPLRNDSGQIVSWAGTITDIDDQKRSEVEMESIIESIPDPFFSLDRQWRFVYVNYHAEEFIQRKRQELIGKVFYEEFPEAIGTKFQLETQRVFDEGIAVTYEEFYTPLGMWLEVRAFPSRVGVSVSYCDITDKKRIEMERTDLLSREQNARQQAESASRMKDEFLAIVSHELRSPLNAMLGWSRLLRTRKMEQATVDRALEAIERNAQAQTQLIEDLLDISRIIRGKIRLMVRPIQLSRAIAAAVDTIRPTASTKHIFIHVDLDENLVVSGDFDRLQQIVWNLLSNAVKFTPDGGRVEARLRRGVDGGESGWGDESQDEKSPTHSPIHSSTHPPIHSTYAQITITDSGKGINPAFLPYVFDRFRQADGSTSRTQGGLGLGLAIVRNLVELHGGSVEVDSLGEGRGATFIVRLPLLVESQTATSECPSLAPSVVVAPSLEGLRVLVVDDNADTREFLAIALAQYGAVIIEATSAREALQKLQQEKPDVLLSDIGMPEQDGYSLIREVRSLPPESGGTIPAAALTAYVRDSDRLQALSAGFQLHIPKPIDPTRLLQVVNQLAAQLPSKTAPSSPRL